MTTPPLPAVGPQAHLTASCAHEQQHRTFAETIWYTVLVGTVELCSTAGGKAVANAVERTCSERYTRPPTNETKTHDIPRHVTPSLTAVRRAATETQCERAGAANLLVQYVSWLAGGSGGRNKDGGALASLTLYADILIHVLYILCTRPRCRSYFRARFRSWPTTPRSAGSGS